MWQFLTKNNEDEEYEKMPDFENEQSMKAQPKVTEEALSLIHISSPRD